MTKQTLAEGSPGSLPSHSERPSVSSSVLTFISTLFVIASVVLIIQSSSSLSPFDRMVAPERSLERLVSRTMEFEQALMRVNEEERRTYRLLSGNEDVLDLAIVEYRELTNYSEDPLVDLYLAVLEAEAGNRDEVAKTLQLWKEMAPPFPLYGEILQAAYFQGTSAIDNLDALQAHLAEEVPENWFYSRLAMQLAQRRGDTSFELLAQQNLDSRARQLLWSTRLLVFTEVGGCVIGLFVIIMLIRVTHFQPAAKLRICQNSLPPSWALHEGYAVLIRGAALTVGLVFVLLYLGPDSGVPMMASMAVLYCPILVLAYYDLLAPNRLSVIRAFGLSVALRHGGRILSVIFMLWAASFIGDLVINLGTGASNRSFHWTEWFDQSLVWGTPGDVAMTLVVYVMLAPLCEELIFRGVLFASLRRRFGWKISAILSALVFSLFHGYGLVGLLTVFWSGVLWAWAYEKTGSLWPGLVAHAINNLLVSLTLVVLYR